MRKLIIALALCVGGCATQGLLSRGNNSIEPCTVDRQQAVEIADRFCADKGMIARQTADLGRCEPAGFWSVLTGTASHYECVKE